MQLCNEWQWPCEDSGSPHDTSRYVGFLLTSIFPRSSLNSSYSGFLNTATQCSLLFTRCPRSLESGCCVCRCLCRSSAASSVRLSVSPSVNLSVSALKCTFNGDFLGRSSRGDPTREATTQWISSRRELPGSDSSLAGFAFSRAGWLACPCFCVSRPHRRCVPLFL